MKNNRTKRTRDMKFVLSDQEYNDILAAVKADYRTMTDFCRSTIMMRAHAILGKGGMGRPAKRNQRNS